MTTPSIDRHHRSHRPTTHAAPHKTTTTPVHKAEAETAPRSHDAFDGDKRPTTPRTTSVPMPKAPGGDVDTTSLYAADAPQGPTNPLAAAAERAGDASGTAWQKVEQRWSELGYGNSPRGHENETFRDPKLNQLMREYNAAHATYADAKAKLAPEKDRALATLGDTRKNGITDEAMKQFNSFGMDGVDVGPRDRNLIGDKELEQAKTPEAYEAGNQFNDLMREALGDGHVTAQEQAGINAALQRFHAANA